MALSAFDDKSKPPQETELAAMLGSTWDLWEELRRSIGTRFVPLSEDWGFSSKSTGWGLRLKRDPRTVLYMTPCKGYFLASFALGEKAVAVARASDLPTWVLEAIETAPRYAEGRGVRFEIRSSEAVRCMEQLAVIKMAT
jgi:hypothetical protein